MFDLTKLRTKERNPRKISEAQMQRLKQSLVELPKMLRLRPLVYDPETMEVIGGNQRLAALISLGYTDVPDEWVVSASDLTPEERRRFVIADNVGFGSWDAEILGVDWDSAELEAWGLEPEAWSPIRQSSEVQEDDYEVPDEIKTDILPGDLFEIGSHRLLCGDSTNADDVQKLLNGKEPYLMVTDPPYGVEYDASWRNDAAKAAGRPQSKLAVGKVTNDDRYDWTEAYSLSPAKVAYIWHAALHASTVQGNLELCSFNIRSQIIWSKNNQVFSRSDYHWKHEPCWYAVKKGNKGNWAGDRKQTTVWNINKPMKSETGHSTQKPVECMARPIANHDGDVYDPFLGSGTTMVASHQLARKCYAMEITPKYCQVVLDRMSKLDPTIEIKRNGKIWQQETRAAADQESPTPKRQKKERSKNAG